MIPVPAARAAALASDRVTGTVRRYAFYGLTSYEADPATFDATVKVTTLLVADKRGNVFFGFTTFGSAPLGPRAASRASRGPGRGRG
jgi:hypothetical protein